MIEPKYIIISLLIFILFRQYTEFFSYRLVFALCVAGVIAYIYYNYKENDLQEKTSFIQVITATLGIVMTILKAYLLVFIAILLRWTTPRVRIDQLLDLGKEKFEQQRLREKYPALKEAWEKYLVLLNLIKSGK